MTKGELRTQMRAVRESMSSEAHAQNSKKICEKIRELSEFQHAHIIGSYQPMHHEVDLTKLTDERCTFPVWDSNGMMFPRAPDLLLIPGLVFDRRGFRIGYGKGYYDAFLQHSHAKKVGICFTFQLIDEFPQESWDIPMDIIVTETETLFLTH